jgi:hypothetical protein
MKKIKLPIKELNLLHSFENQTLRERPDLDILTDAELLEYVNNPKDEQYVTINEITNKVIQGNHRAYQLLQRALRNSSIIQLDTLIIVEIYKPIDFENLWEDL